MQKNKLEVLSTRPLSTKLIAQASANNIFIEESSFIETDIWVADDQFQERALPFIAQQIAVVLNKENIVATMHDAYDIIAEVDYGYAAFIAGPSKTADIEQSLVLGAHGPKTMTVFLMG